MLMDGLIYFGHLNARNDSWEDADAGIGPKAQQGWMIRQLQLNAQETEQGRELQISQTPQPRPQQLLCQKVWVAKK